MRTKKLLIFAAALISLSFFLLAGCSKSNEKVISSADHAETQDKNLKIVASTSWTGYMGKAAGAENIAVIAPVELRHPPEYDLKPGDIQALKDADWIIFAGYEPFMNKMISSDIIPEEKIIKVTTVNTYENLTEQTRHIAKILGTEKQQQEWEAEFSEVMADIKEKAQKSQTGSKRVLVHTHLSAFAKSLGYDVVGIFGAEELSPAKIKELADLNPDLIIDNYHNPQGKTIAELSGAERVELKNFPGAEHNDLIDLFIDNAKKLNIYYI